ncbi:MAG: hypothetical protein RLZZ500_108 [Bacteroidota bacterium]|jgi:N-acetylglutamate synthase-like GNAT family acetyltransferase
MEIRVALSEDIEQIQSLAKRIWPIAYSSILSQDQLHYMLDKFYHPQALQEQMDLGQTFFLLEEASQPVGFAAVALNEKPNATKLHKLYVLPELHGKGRGKALLNYCCGFALKYEQKSIFLNVNRFNKAISFYEKLGFECIETVDIPIGNGYLMEDYIMQKFL